MRRPSILFAVCVVASSRMALADVSTKRTGDESVASDDRLVWRWRRPGTWEYAASGALGVAALAVQLYATQPEKPRWVRPVWFDTSVHDVMTSKSRQTRERTSLYSDYMGLGTQVWAYVDSVVVPLATDGANIDVAWQMTFINLQATSLVVLGTRGVDRLVVRQRPDVEPCERDPNYHDMCFQGPYDSFPSGHTSGAFVGAGLVCAHHLHLPLYGHPYADAAACVVATGAAVSTGVLRLVADRHYVTDVLAGAAIGATAGFVMPMFAHYWFVESSDPTALVRGFTWLPRVSTNSFELTFAALL